MIKSLLILILSVYSGSLLAAATSSRSATAPAAPNRRVPGQPAAAGPTNFTAERWGPAALLRWNTGPDQHPTRFIVEGSTDGRHFFRLDQVPSRSTSAPPQPYQYADLNLARFVGPIYYRLRQVEANGQVSCSPVRTLSPLKIVATSRDNLRLQVAPNPVSIAAATVAVRGARSAQAQLLDEHGQVVASAPVGPDGRAELPVAGLPAGIYVVRCGTANARLMLAN